MRSRAVAIVVFAAMGMVGLGAGGLGAPAVMAKPLSRGVVDNDAWFGGTTTSNQSWLVRTASAGARVAQIEVDWSTLEPSAPSGGDPASAGNPAYDFAWLDQRVQAVTTAGLEPLLLVTGAPRWAEGVGGTTSEYASGGYKPNPQAFGQLAHALAQRYSGSYVVGDRRLPRVRYLQAWGEANLAVHLSPQWTRTRGRWVNTGATLYREMLNDFSAGVKSAARGDQVVLSGLAPYGDKPGGPNTGPAHDGPRTHPVTFLENLLCLSTRLHKGCKAQTRFDVLAADAYDEFSPTTQASSALDVSTPSLDRLVRVEQAALRAHTLLPAGRKPLWVTEFGYDSNPPDRSFGYSPATQARFTEQSLYVFWSEGVSVALAHLVRDESASTSAGTYLDFSGLYYNSGAAKPALTAYRFPFVLSRAGKNARAWGIAPASGALSIQRQHGHRWLTVARLHVHTGAVFTKRLAGVRAGSHYRAVVEGQTSLTWHY
jgi:hypothetical protein